MDYSTFREFSVSWGLIYLFMLFLGIAFFTFRPGSKKIAKDISMIPFREDDQDG